LKIHSVLGFGVKFQLVSTLLFPLALAAIGACGGDEVPRTTTASPTASTSTTPRPLPSASAGVLSPALLSTNDLGEGWTEHVPSSGATVADSIYCGTRVESLKIDAIAIFDNRMKARPFLVEALSKLENDAAARAALDKLNAAHLGCADWTSTDGVSRTDWHTESFVSGDIGDQSLVEKSTAEFPGLPGRTLGVTIVVRLGDTVMTIAEIGVGDLPVAEGLEIAAKAIARYRSTRVQQ
jgi:hypothetical protein